MTSLDGKVALVTGAHGGIGQAIALRLAREGAAVVVHHRANAPAAAEVVATIEAGCGRAVAVAAELSDPNAVRAMTRTAIEHFGGLDIVVHNAAVGIFKPHAEVSEEDFERVIGTNIRGSFYVLQEAARHVRDGGRIVTLSVAGTRMPFPMAGLNNGSRAAVDQMVLSLAKELGPRGITANVVALGMVDTEALHRVVPEAFRTQVRAQTPLGRLGRPEDIAGVVAFLTGPDAAWVSGQVIGATGGLV